MNEVPQAPRKSSPWPWILGLGCGIPVLLFAGCIAFVGNVAHEVAKDPKIGEAIHKVDEIGKNTAAEKVEPVGAVKISRDDLGFIHVKGVLRNKTDEAIPYLEIKLIGNDKSGARVDEGMANTSDLGPREKWAYDVTFTKSEVVKIADVKVSTTPL